MAHEVFPRVAISSCTRIGKRVAQEVRRKVVVCRARAALKTAPVPLQDRCVVYPRVHGRDDVQLLAVFDGTVGGELKQSSTLTAFSRTFSLVS